MTVSVVMASYNGEAFIQQQIESILPQLGPEDEFLISDDGSTDATLSIIQSFQKNNHQIVLIKGPKKGPSANFEEAMKHAGKEIVLLTDQDDIWIDGKVSAVKEAFERHPNIDIFLHNAGFCDTEGKPLSGDTFAQRGTRHGVFHNWLKSGYYGCCMGIRRSFLEKALPFPVPNVLHDQYLGLIAEWEKTALFSDNQWIWHRLHGSNQSQRQPFFKMISVRWKLLYSLLAYRRRVKK